MFTSRVVVSCVVGLVLVVAFVPWALRQPQHPPAGRSCACSPTGYMTVAVITMSLFAIAFFGASLLFPLYFQQVRGETPLPSGWLVAPQGFGAMLTMPDRRLPGRPDRPRQGRADRPRRSTRVGHGDVRRSSTTTTSYAYMHAPRS